MLPYDPLPCLKSLPGDMVWAAGCALWPDFTLPGCLALALLCLTLFAFLPCRLPKMSGSPYSRAIIAFVIGIAFLGPAFLYIPGFFANYKGYWPSPHPEPHLALLLRGITTLMGVGNPNYVSMRNVSDCSYALAGWTIDSWLFFLFWKQMSHGRRLALLTIFLLPWVLMAAAPNSPLSCWIG